jgi:hypothetical protein
MLAISVLESSYMEIKNFTSYVSVKTHTDIYIYKNILYIHTLYILIYTGCMHTPVYIYRVYIQDVVHPVPSFYIYIQGVAGCTTLQGL